MRPSVGLPPELVSLQTVVRLNNNNKGKSASFSGESSKKMATHNSSNKVTPKQLREILSDRYYSSTVTFRHYDEILPGIFIGDMKTAKNVFNLEKMGVTHVLNAAYAPSPFSERDPSQEYYDDRNFPCTFLGIPAQDFPSFRIDAYFEETTAFIHEALKSNGKVLVHCQVGVSRSATIVIAYLMIKMKLSAVDAVTFVGSIRPIFPNEGFLKQICELEAKLRNPKHLLLRSFSSMSRKTFQKVFNGKTF